MLKAGGVLQISAPFWWSKVCGVTRRWARPVLRCSKRRATTWS